MEDLLEEESFFDMFPALFLICIVLLPYSAIMFWPNLVSYLFEVLNSQNVTDNVETNSRDGKKMEHHHKKTSLKRKGSVKNSVEDVSAPANTTNEHKSNGTDNDKKVIGEKHVKVAELMKTKFSDWFCKKKSRIIEYITVDNSYHFTLGKAGGVIELPFGKIDFPTNAVSKSTKLRFVALDIMECNEENITMLTPIVFCSPYVGYDCIHFQRPVNIKMNILQNEVYFKKDVELQVVENVLDKNWVSKKKWKLSEDRNLSFKLQKFAGFRVVIQNPKWDLYHAVYVKRSRGLTDPPQQNFYIMIHTAAEAVLKTRDRTLNSRGVEVVVEPQILPIRFPCTFTATLTCDNENLTSSQEAECYLDSQTENVLENMPVILTKNNVVVPMNMFKILLLKYTVRCDNTPDSIKFFPFQWTVPASFGDVFSDGPIFNVSGSESIGLQLNMFGHQDSSVSEFSAFSHEQSFSSSLRN